jgi:hypothetical protein
VKPSTDFNWPLFLKRTWAGYVISGLWVIQSVLKHDRTGLLLALALGVVLASAIGFVWTRRHPN